jgi:hypothetical protein
MPDDRGTLELKPQMLGIVALPFFVIVVSFVLISVAGAPLNPLAKAVIENGHAEAAGRLEMLATWLLLFIIGCACVGYFLRNLSLFASPTRWWLFGAFIALSVFGGYVVLLGAAEGPSLIGEDAICAAFGARSASDLPGQPNPPSRPGSSVSNNVAGTDNGLIATDNSLQSYPALTEADAVNDWSEGWHPQQEPACAATATHGRMTLMLQLNFIQRLLLALVSPALVLGTIACLATPVTPGEAGERRKSADRKSFAGKSAARLRAHLYLTAGLFVSGLLFLSALLRWPAFAFQGSGHASYLAHVDAFVLYWGVTYSLYIASYYVPVALLLTRQGKQDGVAEDKLPAGELLDWTKTLAALFAPAIVGLLGNVLHL